MGRHDRQSGGEQFTKMVRNTMESDAWRALSPTAQALYPWLKLEWKGPKANNNGKIRLSVRQAAERIGGINQTTASRAFHDLQAKGFIVVTRPAQLGLGGKAQSPAYEITETEMPNATDAGRRLYRDWRKGGDYPISKPTSNNPNGRNGKGENTCLNVVIDAGDKFKTPSSK